MYLLFPYELVLSFSIESTIRTHIHLIYDKDNIAIMNLEQLEQNAIEIVSTKQEDEILTIGMLSNHSALNND